MIPSKSIPLTGFIPDHGSDQLLSLIFYLVTSLAPYIVVSRDTFCYGISTRLLVPKQEGIYFVKEWQVIEVDHTMPMIYPGLKKCLHLLKDNNGVPKTKVYSFVQTIIMLCCLLLPPLPPTAPLATVVKGTFIKVTVSFFPYLTPPAPLTVGGGGCPQSYTYQVL